MSSSNRKNRCLCVGPIARHPFPTPAVRAAAARVRETLGDGCSPPEESLVDALDTAVRGGGGAVTFGKFRAALCAHEGLARVTAARVREHEARVRRASAAERAREYRDP